MRKPHRHKEQERPAEIYPSNFESKIGFDSVRRMISTHCVSETGRRMVDDMSFSTDFETVTRWLRQTDEMVRITGSNSPLQLGGITDAAPWLKAARVPGSFIDAPELGLLRTMLLTAEGVYGFFEADRTDNPSSPQFPELGKVAEGLNVVPEVTGAINKVLGRTGDILDNASPTLHDIRRELATLSSRINSAMRRVLANAVREGYVEADVTPAVRDGRLVIPVAPMHKRHVQGIVHDESASGKTFFIEPAEVVELNNRQRQLEVEERHEIIRILTELTAFIRPYIDQLLETCSTLGLFDFISAKALFAIETRASLPHLSPKPGIEWFTARHPVLQLNLEHQNREIVPLEIKLDKDHRILLISGPNAGGKSVTLKTVGIIQYMMQCGVLPTLYENSHMGMMDAIFVDIGDDQSIEDDLSTYSSHLRNMKYILTHGDNRTLILIDEFGSGTEPQIGGAIAQALLARFNEQGMWGVITTHYQNLKTMAEDTPGLINGSMLYDRQLMQPLFRLSIGHPGSSFALEIARKTGLPEDVINAAREIVGSDYVNLDKYLLDITRDKRYWENKRQQIRQKEKHLEDVIQRYESDAEQLRSSRRAIIEDARTQAQEILASSNAAIERTIHDIRKAQAEKEATAEARKKLLVDKEILASEDSEEMRRRESHPLLSRAPKPKKKKAESTPKTHEEPLRVNDNVLLDNGGQPGTILAIEGKKATVAFGTLKTSVALNRLTRTIRKPKTGMKAASFISAETTGAMRDKQLNFKNEIDLRGMRADEAIQAVTYYIDEALQFGIGRVRILHGTGTGALRVAIREYLASVNGVTSYHDEDVRFGGAGITVVEM